MFNQERGLGPGKWLWWFMGLVVLYAFATLLIPSGEANAVGEEIGKDAVYVAVIAFCAWRIYKAFKRKSDR
jgi:hypothetical protein